MTLKDAWEGNAEAWIRWARAPGHDSYWRFHREQFLQLLPPPGRLTIDVGCGEGRLPRDLKALGHRVVGVDASPTLLEAARAADPGGEYLVADAVALPLPDGCADLVVAHMSLHDVDDLSGVVREIARVLVRGGRLCAAVVHPLNSAGEFEADEPDAPFRIAGSYLEPRRYTDRVERDGLAMTFESVHRPLEGYCRPLEEAGLLVEAVREHPVPDEAITPGLERGRRWQRIPLFLHIRGLKP